MAAILSIDQSTQGTKGLIWDLNGNLLGRAYRSHKQKIDDNGWIGHDLDEIWNNVKKVSQEAIVKSGINKGEVLAIGLTNQRETSCCWNRDTGLPLCDAVVWQCGRASEITSDILRSGWGEKFREKTGLILSPFFSAPKFRWMLENEPEVYKASRQGKLCCGTVDSYLLFRLTKGKSFRTDHSNASRTGLLNLDEICWDEELVSVFGLDKRFLPQICFSDSLFGETDLDGLFERQVPIHAILGDSHAALFAHHCIEPFSAKVTYGTGSSVMMNAGYHRPKAAPGVVTSLAWGMKERPTYCIEGNINNTGSIITWLTEDMNILDKPSLAGKVASSLADNAGVYLVPAFSGLGAPYYNSEARAAIVGMSRSTVPAHIVRAAEECIAYQISDVVQAIGRAVGRTMEIIHADGGPTKDEFLMQFQSDILDIRINISGIEEYSGAGAAYCAAIGGGFSTEEILFKEKDSREIVPNMDSAKRNKLLEGWKKALNMIAGV